MTCFYSSSQDILLVNHILLKLTVGQTDKQQDEDTHVGICFVSDDGPGVGHCAFPPGLFPGASEVLSLIQEPAVRPALRAPDRCVSHTLPTHLYLIHDVLLVTPGPAPWSTICCQ